MPGFFSGLFKAKETIEGLGGFAINIREAIVGKEADPMKQLELISKANEVQAEINLAESKNPSTFVAGWRPFIGWVGGIGLLFNFVIRPILNYILLVFSPLTPTMESLDMSVLMTLLIGMLGIGGLRTYEKAKGITH